MNGDTSRVGIQRLKQVGFGLNFGWESTTGFLLHISVGPWDIWARTKR